MAKTPVKRSPPKRSSYYNLDGAAVTPNRRYCPRCGPGVFLGEHADRVACGKCGYTEFKEKA